MRKKFLVTDPYLPPLEQYVEYLKTIWGNHWLTNQGPLVSKLEAELAKFLGVRYVFFVSNGTIAIQIALRALNITGKVLTTPFSFVATTTSLLWEHCKPVFVDIEPSTFCLNSELIESKINSDVEAILPVHVYGYPCPIEEISDIAKHNHLKVIYDAAHAFGTGINGKSILAYGDISTLSFHATKLFNTGEGGAVVTNNDHIATRIKSLRDFGYDENDNLNIVGVNGKNSEFHAALGLCNLPQVPIAIQNRRRIVEFYDSLLLPSGKFYRPKIHDGLTYNYAYYPILFNSEAELLKVKFLLEEHSIFPRRYFYPSLNILPYVGYEPCPVSESVAPRMLCLPLSNTMTLEDAQHIAELVVSNL